MMSKRYVRYGLSRDLFRVLSVHLRDNQACAGGVLHLVQAVRVSDGTSASWWIPDSELPAYV